MPRSRLIVGLGERGGDLLQRLALRVNAQEHLDEATDNHDAPADQVTNGEAGAARAVSDQRTVEGGADRPDDLGEGEEHRERLGADLDREDLTDRQVPGAGPGGRAEE